MEEFEELLLANVPEAGTFIAVSDLAKLIETSDWQVLAACYYLSQDGGERTPVLQVRIPVGVMDPRPWQVSVSKRE